MKKRGPHTQETARVLERRFRTLKAREIADAL